MRATLTGLLLISCTLCGCARWLGARFLPDTLYVYDTMGVEVDSLGRSYIIIDNDTLHTAFLPQPELRPIGPLRDSDYDEIAAELGIETAAIRAVVEIETGKQHKGFNADGTAIINFDLPVFRRAAARRGVNLSKHSKSEALKPVNITKYGSQQAAQHARLEAAMQIDSVAAVESTFWGMFQIGGFNWKLCGAASREEFVERMKRSEYDQLSLFANYIRNTGLLQHLKNKNWAAFARIYNGPSYASRGYHTRMAAAYRKYKK